MVEYTDGESEIMTANVIAENILSQVDDYGYSQRQLDEILDHRTTEDAVPKHEGWDVYLKNIKSAQRFHEDLSGKYHPNTVAFYGDGSDGSNGQTWGTVRWEMHSAVHMQPVVPGASQTRAIPRPPVMLPAAAMAGLQVQSDSGAGQIVAKLAPGHMAEFLISGKDSPGDGTVPVISGQAPATAGAKLVYHLNLDAEGHEGAYRVPMAQHVTLHAILRMAKEVPVVI